jgi:RimJ/RimL family protein N-acetyltransferase
MFARTERLLLRPGWREDAPALFRAICDERIATNLTTVSWPYQIEDAKAFLTRERSPAACDMLVFLRTSGAPELIGNIALKQKPDGRTVLGYWITPDRWGRGYATEAARAVIDIARDGLRLPALSASHFRDNPASGRVLRKLGFQPTGRVAPCFSAGRRGPAQCVEYGLDMADPAAGDNSLAVSKPLAA